MSQPTPAPVRTYFRGGTWTVSGGAILVAVSVFVATIAPEIHSVAPWFGPAHQKIALALGVLLLAVGNVLSHQGGTQSTQDLRNDVRAEGLAVPPVPVKGTGDGGTAQ